MQGVGPRYNTELPPFISIRRGERKERQKENRTRPPRKCSPSCALGTANLRGYGPECTKPSHSQSLAIFVANVCSQGSENLKFFAISFAKPFAVAGELIHSAEFAAFLFESWWQNLGTRKGISNFGTSNSGQSPWSPIFPVGCPGKKIYVPCVPRIAHKYLTPGHPAGRLPSHRRGHRPKRFT